MTIENRTPPPLPLPCGTCLGMRAAWWRRRKGYCSIAASGADTSAADRRIQCQQQTADTCSAAPATHTDSGFTLLHRIYNATQGFYNTGCCNTGFCNKGSCDTGYCNTGFCNTQAPNPERVASDQTIYNIYGKLDTEPVPTTTNR